MSVLITPQDIGRYKMSKYLSRKFLIAVASAVFMVLNEGLALGVPEDVYWYLVGIVGFYILGEAWVDSNR